MVLNDKWYDALKWVAQYLLPGLATAYFGLADLWGLPATEQVVATILAISVFLGAILGLSNMQFNKEKAIYYQAMGMSTAAGETARESAQEANGGSMLMANGLPTRVYAFLKWAALLLLPAFGSLYLALSTQWGWPKAMEVQGTVAILSTLIGLFLGVNTAQYKKGPNA